MLKKKYNLIKIIYYDLKDYWKMELFLLLLIIVSAMSVVLVTYQTRCMVIDREQLLLEQNFLICTWHTLVMKEEMLSSFRRVEHIALNKLNMRYLNIQSITMYE